MLPPAPHLAAVQAAYQQQAAAHAAIRVPKRATRLENEAREGTWSPRDALHQPLICGGDGTL